MLSSPVALAALIAAVTALAFWLDHRYRWASTVGASLLAIVLGALLSNAGLVPADSPVYGTVTGPVTSLAIVWLLLAVHVTDLRRAGPRMLGAFALALAGTALGTAVGTVAFSAVFGEDAWRLAGAFMGTYSGGSLNFVAVGRGLELPETLFAGAAAADNLTTGLWLGACLMAPALLGRWYPDPPAAAGSPAGGGEDAAAAGSEAEPVGEATHPFFDAAPVSVLRLAVLFALGLAVLVAARAAHGLVPAVPEVLWLTTFALVLGHLRPFARMDGALQLGNYALHLFFVVIGIYSRVGEILVVGIAVFWFTLTVVGVHGLVVFGVGRAAKLDVGTLSVASQAAVGGPSTALAVAVSRGWPVLVLPGVAVGLLGYAAGNYLGFAVAHLARAAGF